MKRSTCYGCPALNGDGTCTIIIAGRKITITPDMEQGCCAAPVRHGRWLEYENDADRGYHYCSHCKRQAINYSDGGVITEVLSPYCPYCGAKMDTEKTKWH